MYLVFAVSLQNAALSSWAADWVFVDNDSMESEHLTVPQSTLLANRTETDVEIVAQSRGVGTALLLCRFGDRVASAAVTNRTHLQCVTPAAPEAGDAVLAVGFGTTDTERIAWSDSNQSFAFYAANITGASPEHGDHTGASTALAVSPSLSGSVQAVSRVACKIATHNDTVLVPGHYDAGRINCSMPPVPHAMVATIEVTLNGQQYSWSNHSSSPRDFSHYGAAAWPQLLDWLNC